MRLTRGNLAIVAIVLAVLAAVFAVGWYLQLQVDRELSRFTLDPARLQYEKNLGEVAKLRAEIQQIRSDTAGSLFWLKMVALFVTVGGAVGGYLAGLRSTTRRRLRFERRRDIDAAYQGILTELAGDKELLRAAAAVKLGALLKEFPAVWKVGAERRQEMIDLTKRVLAASLSIEKDPTVLKALAAALVMHHPAHAGASGSGLADCRSLDLSRARAGDAYWADTDFTYTDFYAAGLRRSSFRRSVLGGAQFREADLTDAVLAEADCRGANFKLADLRGTDLSGARLDGANFEGAQVVGVIFEKVVKGTLRKAVLHEPLTNPAAEVVLTSETGEPSTTRADAWLASHGVAVTPAPAPARPS
jgi:hypothetical protein